MKITRLETEVRQKQFYCFGMEHTLTSPCRISPIPRPSALPADC